MNGDGNFKMKCIKVYDNNYTEGKIYDVINGHWRNDIDILIGNSNIKTIEDVNKFSSSAWGMVEDETLKELSVSERMEKVANMLGLELDEEFNINLSDGSPSSASPYKFTEHNLISNNSMPVNGLIGALLTGRYKIKKSKWKPKNNEQVWTVTPNNECVWFVFDDKYPDYVACYKMGWIFKTSKEAEANQGRVLAEMKEIMEDD